MTEKKVTIRLNQQQWELVDKTVADGVAASREELLKMALCEYGREQPVPSGPSK